MVTNFEEYTHPLTADEMVMLDLFVAIIKHRTKKTAIKSGEIMRKINAMIEPMKLKTKLTEARLRKMSNHLRRNSLLPLCGTTVGYYCHFRGMGEKPPPSGGDFSYIFSCTID